MVSQVGRRLWDQDCQPQFCPDMLHEVQAAPGLRIS